MSEYYVYLLIDYKGFPFYIGKTKNLSVRIREHSMNKNATPAKAYRVRRSIEKYGILKYEYHECDTKKDADELEKSLITKYRYQLVNKTHGKVKNEGIQRRSKGRSKQCLKCKNWYKKLRAHKCKLTL